MLLEKATKPFLSATWLCPYGRQNRPWLSVGPQGIGYFGSYVFVGIAYVPGISRLNGLGLGFFLFVLFLTRILNVALGTKLCPSMIQEVEDMQGPGSKGSSNFVSV